jgi:hypothetical protein
MSTAIAEPPPVTVNRLPAYIPIEDPLTHYAGLIRHEGRRLWTPEQEMEMRAAEVRPEIVAWIEQRARRVQRRELMQRDYQRAMDEYVRARRELEAAEVALRHAEQVEPPDASGISVRYTSLASFVACCAPERSAIDERRQAESGS